MSAAAVCSILLAVPPHKAPREGLDLEAAAVARFQAGEEAAFEDLVSYREAEVYRLCLRMLGNQEDALDAAQEVFLRVYRALPRFRGEASFRTWVTGIAINVCRSSLGSRAARNRRLTVSLDAADPETGSALIRSPADPAPDPERAAQGAELRGALEHALASLGPEHREVILLREMQGMEYDELARVLGCALGTVKSRLARARGALREALEGLWP